MRQRTCAAVRRSTASVGPLQALPEISTHLPRWGRGALLIARADVRDFTLLCCIAVAQPDRARRSLFNYRSFRVRETLGHALDSTRLAPQHLEGERHSMRKELSMPMKT
jgi:hypothetical protein